MALPIFRRAAATLPALFSLVLLLLLTASGCAPKTTNLERGLEERVFYMGIGTEPEGLDPHLVTGVTEHQILLALLEGLVTRNGKTLEIEPGVARSWDRSADGRTYTFHLDPAARWSNGEPVTAQDFLFSFERILTPALGAPYAYMLYAMKGAEAFNKGEIDDFTQVGANAPDKRTLIIELNAPTPYFLGMLTHYTWWPVHSPTILEHGAMTDRVSDWTKPGNFIGNGPFILKSWKLNAALSAEKNPYYRATEDTWLNGIRFLPIEGDAEERAFRAGYIHVSSTVPIHRIDWYTRNRPENIRFDTYLGTYYFALNVRRGPLGDPQVRRALAYSIDRDAITEHILRGGQQPAFNFTPPGTGGYESRTHFAYDPEKARKLLAEAGFPEGEGFPTLEILYNTSESHRAISLAIQQMWRTELGIDITLYNQEWKVYLDTRKNHNFDVLRAGWIGDYDDPNTFLSLATSDNGNNHTGWGNSAYDVLIAQAAREQDSAARLELFQEAEAILMDEMPFIPIYFYVRSLLIDQSVQGWDANVLDYHPYQSIRLEAK